MRSCYNGNTSGLLKKILTILLALASILATTQYSFTWLIFKVNQNYIAKNLCVQKDVEDNSCQGCCQLKKQMEQQSEQEKTSPNPNQREITIDGFITCKLTFSPTQSFREILFKHIDKPNYNSVIIDVFHPPQYLI